MKILFSLLGEVGHINPFVGICKELIRIGHVVAIRCPRDFSAQLARAGLDVEWFCNPEPASLARPEKMAERMRDERWLERWYALGTAATLPALALTERAIAAFQPDALCIDALDVAAAIAAERHRVPWAAISTSFTAIRPSGTSCMFLDVGERALARLRDEMEGKVLPMPALAGTDVVSPWFNSVFTTEVFAPREATNNVHSHYVGPPRSTGPRGDEPDFPWDSLGARPLVYVSSGGGQSLSFDAQCLLRVARAIDAADAASVISAPVLHEDSAFLGALPASAVVVRYAPQQRLLDRAAALVTHGGANTVNESLDRGCPMLVLPLGKEQPVQAELVCRAGVGIALDPRSLAHDECAAAVRALVAGGSYRERANVVRASYAETDSTRAVVAALEQIARRERPGPP